MPESLQNQTVSASILIVGLPEYRQQPGFDGEFRHVWRFEAILSLNEPSTLRQWPGKKKVLLYWSQNADEYEAIKPGQHWQIKTRLRRPRGWVNEYGFDAERHALVQGWTAKGSVLSARSLTNTADSVLLVRWRLAQMLHKQLSAWPLAQQLIPALICGDRRWIDDATREQLSRTGTAHLIAISGLHISLVTIFVWWFSRIVLSILLPTKLIQLLTLKFGSIQLVALFPAALSALIYAALAGFSAATLRAMLMALAVSCFLLCRQQFRGSDILLLAVTVMTVINPLIMLDQGLWMSLVAVILLLYLQGRGLSIWRIQGALCFIPGPLLSLWFGTWGVAAFFTNLVMVPLFSFLVVPMALMGAGLLFFELPVGAVLVESAARLLQWLWPLVEAFSRWPVVSLPGGLIIALLTVISMIALFIPGWFGPRLIVLLVAVSIFFFDPFERPDNGEMRLIVFDVGQGQAVVVQTTNHLLLFDSGGRWPDGDAGQLVLNRWLARQPQVLSMIIVSHGDQDHMGGLRSVRRDYPHAMLISGEPERVPNSMPCKRGQFWLRDGLDIEVLWPQANIPIANSNNRSCVLRISSAYGSVLLTGDIEKPVEFWLAQKGGIQADLLQLGHHGSKTSSSYGFLRAVSPQMTFVSSGYANRFGHPAAQTRSRLTEFNYPLFGTAQQGMLQFTLDDTGWSAKRWRGDPSLPWREHAAVVE